MASNLNALRALEDKYVKCRAHGHRWSDIEDDPTVRSQFQESRTVRRMARRCYRCTTRKWMGWNRITGAILFNAYKYPNGYKLTGAGIKHFQVRKEFLNRTIG